MPPTANSTPFLASGSSILVATRETVDATVVIRIPHNVRRLLTPVSYTHLRAHET